MANSGNLLVTNPKSLYSLIFSWNSEVVSEGKTEVYWNLELRNPNALSLGLTYTITIDEVKVKEGQSGGSFSNPSVANGEILKQHDNNGKAILNVLIEGKINTETFSQGALIELDKNRPVVACSWSQQSSITITYNNTKTSIIPPKGNIRIIWNGAKPGLNNEISGYKIFLKRGSVTVKTIEVTDPSAASYDFKVELPYSERGSTSYRFGIQIIGKAGFNSEILTSSLLRINILPAAPEISFQKIIPSSAINAKIECKKNSTDEDGQETSIWFGSSESQKKLLEDSYIHIPTPDEGRTYTQYFWQYDGMEYSEPVIAKITKNTKPKITINFQGTSLSIDDILKENYIISPQVNIEPIDGQANNKYTYYLKYGTNETNLNNSITLLSNSLQTQYINSDIRVLLKEQNIDWSNGLYYKISVIRNDGIENSEEYSSGIYWISGFPKIIKISGEKNDTHFLNKIIIDFDKKDQGYNNFNFLSNNNSLYLGELSSKKITLTGEERFKNLKRGQSHSFSVIYYYNNSNFGNTSINHSLYRISSIDIQNFDAGISPFNVYNYSTSYTAGLTNFFKVTSDQIQNIMKDFGLSENKKLQDYISFYFTKGKNIPINSLTYLSGDIINFTYSGESVYNALPSNLDKNSNHSIRLYFEIKNEYDEIFYYDQTMVTIEFINNNNLSWIFKIQDQNNINITEGSYVKEGMDLYLVGEIRSYNKPQSVYLNDGRYIASIPYHIESEPAPNSPGKYTFNYQIRSLYQSEGEKLSYSLKIKINEEEIQVLNITNITVLGHISPTISNITTDYNIESKTLTITGDLYNGSNFFEEENTGATFSVENNEVFLYLDGSNINPLICTVGEDFLKSETFTLDFNNFDFGEKDKIKINLSFNTVLYFNKEPSYKTTKTSQTLGNNYAFNLTPTISYRKNHIGINTSNTEKKEEAIVIIGSVNNRNTIFYDQLSAADLCIIENFLIDGGTW